MHWFPEPVLGHNGIHIADKMVRTKWYTMTKRQRQTAMNKTVRIYRVINYNQSIQPPLTIRYFRHFRFYSSFRFLCVFINKSVNFGY